MCLSCRHPNVHSCTFDTNLNYKLLLEKQNPKIECKKIDKI